MNTNNRQLNTSISFLSITLLVIMACSGCITQRQFTGSLVDIEPELNDFTIPLEIMNRTHEYDFQDPIESNPIYGKTIPEYLFVRYAGERKSINLFALKMESINDAKEIFEVYKQTYLEYAVALEINEPIGDQTFLCQTTFGGINGYGLEFRLANVVIVLVGMTVEQSVFENIALTIEQDIKNHLE